jgi:hypothetical protein
MTQIRMRNTGELVTEYAYMCGHPTVSFEAGFVPDDADRLVLTDAPPTTIHQRAVRSGAELVGGQWYSTWIILPAVPPESVSMLNVHLALIEAGHMEKVEAHLSSLDGVAGQQARAVFRLAQQVRRDHPLVDTLRVALDLTPGEIDALFISAAALG